MEEMFNNLNFTKQPKNTITLTLKNADGSIDKEMKIENTVCALAASRANMWYKGMPVANYYYGLRNPYPGDNQGLFLVVRSWNPGVSGNNFYLTNYEGYYEFWNLPYDATDTTQNSTFYVVNVVDATHLQVNNTNYTGMTAGDTITQGANTTTITSVIDSTHIQVASTTGWLGMNNSTNVWTAFNFNNQISTTGTADGIYLPQSSGFTSDRGYTWTYEWGTTQGNGTLSSVAFQSGDATPSFSQGQGAIQIATTPQFQSNANWQYAGWKTSGSARQLYFVNKQLGSNNVTILNYSDFSLVGQKTITNPTVANFGAQLHDILYTPVSGGNFYAITATASNSFTYAIAPEASSTTFGTPVTVSGLSVPGWSNSGYIIWNNWTADQTYIYALISDVNNAQSAILTFNPATNTVVSIVKNPAGMNGVGGGNYVYTLFNICPVTGKLFRNVSAYYVAEWPSITQPTLQRYVTTIADGSPSYYYPTFMMEQMTDRLVMNYFANNNQTYNASWFELTKGEFDTYAELPSPLTKVNNQSLVVSYTLNFD